MRERSFWENIFYTIIEYWFVSLIIFILLVGSGYYLFAQTNNSKNLETYEVKKENLEQIITLTGTVKPTEEAEVSFEKTGVLKTVDVKLGDRVEAGQVLAIINDDDERVKVLEAKANLSTAQASLADSQTGSKEEVIEIKKAALEKSNNDLELAYKNAGDSVKNLSITGNSVVRDNFAKYFDGSFQTGYRINIASCDFSLENQINNSKKQAEESLRKIEYIAADFNSLDKTSQKEKLNEVKNILIPQITEQLDLLKNIFSLNCLLSNRGYDSDRVLISSSRNAWASLNTDLSIKINTVDSATSATLQAEKDLQLAERGEKTEKVKQAEAQVRAAKARLEAAEILLEKNILRAPFAGIVTSVDLKKGEFVGVGTSKVSMISDANFQIESKVSEVDVARLYAGEKAEVTFDAYTERDKFQAVVSNISPAGIISEGVPTYKTIFDFINKDERIKSGMTANLSVVTNTLQDVVTIPARFISVVNGEKFVFVKNGNSSKQVKIKTGVIGLGGKVEVLEGLSGGEVLYLQK